MNLRNRLIVGKAIVLIIILVLGGCASPGLYKITTDQNDGVTMNSMLIASGKQYGGNIRHELRLVHAQIEGTNRLILQFNRNSLNAQLAAFGSRQLALLSGSVYVSDERARNIITLESAADVRVINHGNNTFEVFAIPIDEEILRTLFAEERMIIFTMRTVGTATTPTNFGISREDYRKAANSINLFYQRFYGQPLGL